MESKEKEKQNKTTAKKATTKKPKVVKESVTKPDPQTDLLATLSSLNPEVLAQLVALAQGNAVPEKVEKPSTPKRLSKSYLNSIRDEEVEVRNLTEGLVVYTSQKSGATYKWMGRDEIEIMTVGEVMAMHSQSEKFLKTPWLIVENEDVMVSLGLSTIHQQVADFDDLDEVLALPIHEMKAKLDLLSPTYAAQIAEVIGAKILNGEVRDIYLIRALEEHFGRKFLI